MTLIFLNHFRQKGLKHPAMCDRVNFEAFSNLSFGVLKNIMLRHDTSVIHKNCYVSHFTDDFIGSFQYFLAICDIDPKRINLK